MTESGIENRQRARLEFASPTLPQVERWANDQLDEFDPDGHFDRNDYIHAFVTLHEVLEDARVEFLYVEKYPDSAPAFGALAEKEIAEYDGMNPAGAFKLALTRPYVGAAVRTALKDGYLDVFDDDDLDGLTAIFEAFLRLGGEDTAAARKGLAHDLISEDMPHVIGLGFDSGAARQWAFSGELDLESAGAQESFKTFVRAAVARLRVEGTLDSGDVVIILFEAPDDDVWLNPGLRILASSRAGKVWGSLNGFELSESAISMLKTAGWEIIREGDPDAFATKEWWTREGAAIAAEALWIAEDIAAREPGTRLRIVGSDSAREAWAAVTGTQ